MISRRDLLAQLAMAGAAMKLAPAELFAQAQTAAQRFGKEKLIVRSMRPPDFETPVALLDSFITPNELFYVRSHMPVPQVDASTWALKIGGEVNSPLSLSLDEIKKLPAVTITTTLECAGNGRAFFEPALAGIQWEKGAVGTARFTGARMSDVLKKAGVKTSGLNVEMHAADRPPGTMPAFVRQVPMAKAMHPDTIIAWDMNGQPMPLPHGMPLRAIVPGWEGAYSVKWLTALNVLRDRLSLPEQARRARCRGRCEGHGAAQGPRGEITDHDAWHRRIAAGRQDCRRRLRVGRRERRHQGRRLDRQRRHVATGPPHRRAGAIHVAAVRIRLQRDETAVVSDSFAGHRQPGQRAAVGSAMESVGVSLESI